MGFAPVQGPGVAAVKTLSSVTVDGPFTPDELVELLQKVRDIEQREPDRPFTVRVKAPHLTTEEARAILERVQPPLPHIEAVADWIFIREGGTG